MFEWWKYLWYGDETSSVKLIEIKLSTEQSRRIKIQTFTCQMIYFTSYTIN